jgi:hypothetical protein
MGGIGGRVVGTGGKGSEGGGEGLERTAFALRLRPGSKETLGVGAATKGGIVAGMGGRGVGGPVGDANPFFSKYLHKTSSSSMIDGSGDGVAVGTDTPTATSIANNFPAALPCNDDDGIVVAVAAFFPAACECG